MSQIPEEQNPSAKRRKISKTEINELPSLSWEGPVCLLKTTDEMKSAVQSILSETILGFDTETRPSFKRGEYYPPALIQIATSESVFLFQLSKIKCLTPLIPVLESSKIIKCGVGIKGDVKELLKFESFAPNGFFEIGELTKKLGYLNSGLRALAALLLNGRINKGAQLSNWARNELSRRQINYAATDAWISREIYLHALQEMESND